MRVFRYRLGAVLKGAEQAEESRRIALARAEEQLQAAAQRMDSLREAQACAGARLRELQGGEVDLGLLRGVAGEMARVGGLLEQAVDLRCELEANLAGSRGRLLEATRERRRFAAHRDELALRQRRTELLEESKQMDEMASVRHAARSHRGTER